MKICYEEHRFNASTQALVELAGAIIEEYADQGFDLTLRQLYYQMVARGHIDNDQRSYKRMGKTISNARRAGEIDWNAIVDRTRTLRERQRWDSPQQILGAATDGYHRDRWEGQTFRPEVWIEKDALAGVIAGVCNNFDVPYFACRGYVSDSEMWRAGVRLGSYVEDGQDAVVFHLGDMDPSGIDMTRDIQERLALFSGFDIHVERIALSMEQIDEYGPPPNPAKMTDSRYESYIAEYGDESWELDALEPSVLTALIGDRVEMLIDWDPWRAVEDLEEDHKLALSAAADSLPL